MILQRRHNFQTITDADWSRALSHHRQLGHYHGNEIVRRIRARVVAHSMVPPPQPVPNLSLPQHPEQQPAL
jgi:hypothetical protein